MRDMERRRVITRVCVCLMIEDNYALSIKTVFSIEDQRIRGNGGIYLFICNLKLPTWTRRRKL